MAKRIRDIGLPGWWGILAVIIAAALVSSAVSKEAGSGVHTLVWIALLLIPGGSFSRGTHAG